MKRPRGGLKQQLEQHGRLGIGHSTLASGRLPACGPLPDSGPGPLPAPSPPLAAPTSNNLSMKLIEKWCWGSMSLPTLQELAEAGKKDGVDDRLGVLLGGIWYPQTPLSPKTQGLFVQEIWEDWCFCDCSKNGGYV